MVVANACFNQRDTPLAPIEDAAQDQPLAVDEGYGETR